jgi:hypothetical protein
VANEKAMKQGYLSYFMASMITIVHPLLPNTVIRRDLKTPRVKEEIHRYSSQYSARLSALPNA